MALKKSREERIEQLKAEGITKELVSNCKYFQVKEYVLIQADTMGYLTGDNSEEMAISGPIGLGVECMAVTIQGAIELMREDIIECMQDYTDCDEDSKVFISNTIDIDEDVKCIVAAITSENGTRHVDEFIVMPADKMKPYYKDNTVINL